MKRVFGVKHIFRNSIITDISLLIISLEVDYFFQLNKI
jgi:hypothetical protein